MQHEEHAQEICSEPELCFGYFDDKSLRLEAVSAIVGTCNIRLDSLAFAIGIHSYCYFSLTLFFLTYVIC